MPTPEGYNTSAMVTLNLISKFVTFISAILSPWEPSAGFLVCLCVCMCVCARILSSYSLTGFKLEVMISIATLLLDFSFSKFAHSFGELAQRHFQSAGSALSLGTDVLVPSAEPNTCTLCLYHPQNPTPVPCACTIRRT
eukprot:1160898-Pelagomonas_calceolata.AAC.4